jgi:hypothetical protein
MTKLQSQVPLYQQFPREFEMALQKSLSFQLFPSGMIKEQDVTNPAKVQRVAIRILEILKPRLFQGTHMGDLKWTDVASGVAQGVQKVTNQFENIPAVRSGIPVK